MDSKKIQTRQLWLPNCDDTPNRCTIQDSKDSALQHTKSARHGQNQEKEKFQPLNRKFSFQQSFWTANINNFVPFSS